MRESIHLVPKSLKDRLAVHAAAVAHAKAVGQAEPSDLALAEADFKGMSGRVVLLRELGIPEYERVERAAIREFAAAGGSIMGELEAYRQAARVRAMVVGVSDEHVDPRQRMSAQVRTLTDADKEGAAAALDARGEVTANKDGVAKGNGRSFAELFTTKDLVALRVWDRKHHSLSDDDMEEILGEAIPTTDD